jgi:hypothetical protein
MPVSGIHSLPLSLSNQSKIGGIYLSFKFKRNREQQKENPAEAGFSLSIPHDAESIRIRIR